MLKKGIKSVLRIRKAASIFASVMRTGGFATINVTQYSSYTCLEDKHVVITGGGSGIGYATARKCIDLGAHVLITGRNENKLQDAVNSLSNTHSQYLVWDIGDVAKTETNVRRCFELLNGRIDVVINNAGVQPKEFFPEVTSDEWDRIYDINSRGTFFVSQGFCKAWIESPSSTARHLINISSQGGFVGALYPYRLSKWDIRGLTEGLGVMMAPYGILVNGIAPGVVRTEMQGIALKQGDNCYCSQNPIGRVALPEEVAELIAFMISDACNFMVGQTIVLDGGYSLKC